MSISLDGVDDRLRFYTGVSVTNSTNLGITATAQFCIGLWAKARTAGEGNAGTLLCWYSTGGGLEFTFGTRLSGKVVGFYDQSGTDCTSTSLSGAYSLNKWHYFMIEHSGVSASTGQGTLNLFIDGNEVGYLSRQTGVGGPAANFTVQRTAFGSQEGGSTFDGLMNHMQVWDRTLTLSEKKMSMWFPGSVTTRLVSHTITDNEGAPIPNSANYGFRNVLLHNVGGIYSFENPPIGRTPPLRRNRTYYILPAGGGGGNAFTVDLSETITVTNALSKDTLKHFTEMVTVSHALTKIIEKHLTQSATLTEAISKDTTKHLTQTVTISEALSKECLKHLSQTITITEAISKEPQKHISQVVTVTEAISKEMLKHLSQHITVTESVAASLVGVVLPIVVRFLLRGNIETHDKLNMQNDLVSTGILKQDDTDMERDQDQMNWDWHGL